MIRERHKPRTPQNERDIVDISEAVLKAENAIKIFKNTVGVPGISVCISIGGVNILSKGFGYADVEQCVKASSCTKYRIASISKCFTSLLVGRLMEQGKLNLDEDIRSFLPDFSPKTADKKMDKISVRNLLCHTSGLRHYRRLHELDEKGDTPEMLNTKSFDSAHDALSLFRDDLLLHLPGEDYSYTTHGYTLISAVLEAVVARSSIPFESPLPLKMKSTSKDGDLPSHAKIQSLLTRLFAHLSLKDTHLDYPRTIIPHRARQYRRDKDCRLMLAPSVDNSYKWGGGGILSTAPDLVAFANHLSKIYLDHGAGSPTDVVSHRTLADFLWQPVNGTVQGRWLVGGLYGLGWFVARRSGLPADKDYLKSDRLLVGHLGGAMGGTTALLISLPLRLEKGAISSDRGSLVINDDFVGAFNTNEYVSNLPPICVVILTNLEHASGIGSLALELAEIFSVALVDCLYQRRYSHTPAVAA